jgi:hypothetical protein
MSCSRDMAVSAGAHQPRGREGFCLPLRLVLVMRLKESRQVTSQGAGGGGDHGGSARVPVARRLKRLQESRFIFDARSV